MLITSDRTVQGADQSQSNTPPGEVLLTDSLGRVVNVPTNELPRELQPPAKIGLKGQIPEPAKGAGMSREVQKRIEQEAKTVVGLQFFPSVQPRLMPYLASQDELGNTALTPSALIPVTPLD